MSVGRDPPIHIIIGADASPHSGNAVPLAMVNTVGGTKEEEARLSRYSRWGEPKAKGERGKSASGRRHWVIEDSVLRLHIRNEDRYKKT